MTPKKIELHGHPVSYYCQGKGPVLVLIHGITSNADTWAKVMPALAKRFTVIAPDLLGHGQSAKPRGDYSLGAYASGIRDLLAVLGHESATVVGHSLGGGIAMQLAYQFPERVDRLVLVDSGGLGREVNLMLRVATLPGAEIVLPLLFKLGLRQAGHLVGRAFGAVGLHPNSDIQGMAEGFASLEDIEARRAFVHTARSVIDPFGQRVDARDRLYLAEKMPTLLVWGDRDPMIPVHHGVQAHELMPGSRLEIFSGAGHFPFNDDPMRFVDVLSDFMETTEPAEFDLEMVRSLLVKGRETSIAA